MDMVQVAVRKKIVGLAVLLGVSLSVSISAARGQSTPNQAVSGKATHILDYQEKRKVANQEEVAQKLENKKTISQKVSGQIRAFKNSIWGAGKLSQHYIRRFFIMVASGAVCYAAARRDGHGIEDNLPPAYEPRVRDAQGRVEIQLRQHITELERELVMRNAQWLGEAERVRIANERAENARVELRSLEQRYEQVLNDEVKLRAHLQNQLLQLKMSQWAVERDARRAKIRVDELERLMRLSEQKSEQLTRQLRKKSEEHDQARVSVSDLQKEVERSRIGQLRLMVKEREIARLNAQAAGLEGPETEPLFPIDEKVGAAIFSAFISDDQSALFDLIRGNRMILEYDMMNKCDHLGNNITHTLLMAAAGQGKRPMVQGLLEAKASVGAIASKGNNVLGQLLVDTSDMPESKGYWIAFIIGDLVGAGASLSHRNDAGLTFLETLDGSLERVHIKHKVWWREVALEAERDYLAAHAQAFD